MDNFNYQAYLKSGKIYGESKLLTEEVAESKLNKSTLKENSIRFDNNLLIALTDLVDSHAATSGLTDEESAAEMMEFLGQEYDISFEFGRMMQEEAEVNEIGMFMDPIGYKKSQPKEATFTKKYVSPGVYDIFKHGEKIATIKGEGEANAYMNVLMEDDYLQEEKSLEDELLDDLNETAIFEAEEDVDVDVDVEDEVDIDVEEEDDIEIEKTPVKAKIEIGLTPEEEAVQDSLQAAMEASRDLDNSTLTDQIGNTITYFTRQFVVGDNTD
mgnify:CR=1 FL=1